ELRLDAQHRLSGPLHAGWVRTTHVRARSEEERGALDDAELRGLRIRVHRVLRMRLRVPVRRRSGECGAGESRRHPNAKFLPDRGRLMGIPRRQWLLLVWSSL